MGVKERLELATLCIQEPGDGSEALLDSLLDVA
jgi:hypothetical protein